jgi:pimeloyl-ACP methyl ester carboxylesterase
MNEFLTKNGARLRYSDSGQGVPVLFLHPTPLDHQYWQPLIDELAGVRTVMPDLRGHGQSEPGTMPVGAFRAVPDAPVLSVDQLATDVLDLLDQLRIEQTVLVGCSIGGYVLLELWRKAAGRILGLGFICSKPQPDSEANQARRAATIAQARQGLSHKLFDEMAQSLIGESARRQHPEIVGELRAHMRVSTETLVAVQAGLATRPDSLPTVPTITVPVLAIAGGEDPGVTPAEMESFRSAPGGCQFHLLPDAGHLAAYEQPGKVAALLAPWLRLFS